MWEWNRLMRFCNVRTLNKEAYRGRSICRAWNPCATEIYLKGPVKMRGIEFLGVHCKWLLKRWELKDFIYLGDSCLFIFCVLLIHFGPACVKPRNLLDKWQGKKCDILYLFWGEIASMECKRYYSRNMRSPLERWDYLMTILLQKRSNQSKVVISFPEGFLQNWCFTDGV